MNVCDYLAPDQRVELEILEEGKSENIRIPSVIKDIEERSIIVKIPDMPKHDIKITNGKKAQISGDKGTVNFTIPARVVERDDFPLIKLIPVDKTIVTQRRGLVRIEDCLHCTYTVLTRDDYEETQKEFPDTTVNEGGVQALLSKIWYHERETADKNSEMSMAIVQLLVNIDRKLNMILGSFNAHAREIGVGKDAIIENISGSGAKLSGEEEVGIGEILRLEIVLPTFPISPVTILGEVIRVKRPDNARGGRFEIVVKFTEITEEDRDSLIRYVFQKQREMLRSARESND